MRDLNQESAQPAPPPPPPEAVGPQGIAGWLILPAIGLTLVPVATALLLVMAISNYEFVEAMGWGTIFNIEVVVNVALIAFTIYVAVLFFNKKRETPRMYITLILAGLGANFFFLVLGLAMGLEDYAAEVGIQIVRSGVAAAIWIPYFNVSKRVKATFIE